MKIVSQYQCGKCSTSYKHEDYARLCEGRGAEPQPVEVGAEVRLKNRNHGHTVAVVKALKLRPSDALAFVEAEPKPALESPEWIEYVETTLHEWVLVLDREVMLDHKWDEPLSEVPAFYLLTDAALAADPTRGERRDGDCW